MLSRPATSALALLVGLAGCSGRIEEPVNTQQPPGLSLPDMTAPTVTINPPGDVQPLEETTLSGSARDERGLVRVEVFASIVSLGDEKLSKEGEWSIT